MKVTDVLAKVYEPGRLQQAWQQVKQNAGAEGIDRIFYISILSNLMGSVTDRGAVYLASMYRSVGRG